MNPVIKSDGTTFQPPVPTTPGRKPTYPWSHLDVGDGFNAPRTAKPSLTVVISNLKHAGWRFAFERSAVPGMIFVRRTA
ncbi:MAG: hypothetical protein WCY11_01815 [Novosphingobium sp.]